MSLVGDIPDEYRCICEDRGELKLVEMILTSCETKYLLRCKECNKTRMIVEDDRSDERFLEGVFIPSPLLKIEKTAKKGGDYA